MAEVSSEYWAYNDPRWANDPAYGNPETMKYVGPWEQVLQATGFKGKMYEPIIEMQPSEYGGFVPQEVGRQYTPEAKAAIDGLRSAGYDLRWKHPDKRTFNTYYGLVTPSGEVQDIKIEGSDLGDAIMPMIKTWGAGLGLANLGAGLNSLLGGAGAGAAPANALAGGIGGVEGAAFADLAGGMLPEFGTIPAYSAGLGGGAGVLTAADLAALPADVFGQVGPIPQVEVANFPPLGDRTVTNVMAPGVQGAETAAATAPSPNALAQGPYQNLTPTELLQLDLTTTPTSSMIPLPSPSAPLTPLTPFPASVSNVVTPPTFEFGTIADFPASVAGAAPSIPAGIMEGMVPGGLTGAGFPVTAAEIAATNSLLAGLGAGAGIGTLASGGGTAATAAGAAAPVAAAGGAAGGGDFLSGMSDVAATEGAGVAGTGILTKGTNIPSAVLGGGSILDKAIDLIKSPAGGALLSGVGSVVGGITQANAAEAAANQQAEAARNALQLQREMFEYQKNLLAPYQKYGTAALERLSGALGLEGAAKSQQMLEMDPGYGFRLGEGLKALERMQAARGSMLSGGALKAGQQYAQNFASNEYDRAFGRLADIAGIGRSTAAQQGTAAQQFGTSAGNVMGQEANALAAGRYGRASAYTGALEGVLGAYENYLNRGQRNQLARDIYGRMLGGGS